MTSCGSLFKFKVRKKIDTLLQRWQQRNGCIITLNFPADSNICSNIPRSESIICLDSNFLLRFTSKKSRVPDRRRKYLVSATNHSDRGSELTLLTSTIQLLITGHISRKYTEICFKVLNSWNCKTEKSTSLFQKYQNLQLSSSSQPWINWSKSTASKRKSSSTMRSTLCRQRSRTQSIMLDECPILLWHNPVPSKAVEKHRRRFQWKLSAAGHMVYPSSWSVKSSVVNHMILKTIMQTATKEGVKHTMMFDAGPEGQAWEKNARRLGVDLASIERIQLSHWHRDHSGS